MTIYQRGLLRRGFRAKQRGTPPDLQDAPVPHLILFLAFCLLGLLVSCVL